MRYVHLTLKDGTEGIVEVKDIPGVSYSEEDIIYQFYTSSMIRVDSRNIWISPDFIYSIQVFSRDEMEELAKHEIEENTNEPIS